MITAYASTDTAVKAIRLGALDYISKPFTPDELRSTVERALTGELAEATTSEEERKAVDLIDIDIPFDRAEVSKYAGEDYARMLGPSDMPVVEVPAADTLENYCAVGEMVCDIFKKLGTTCKAGTKTAECPQKKAKKKKAAGKGFDAKKLIGIDQPFDYEEVVAITGPEYVQNLHNDGVVFVPYEELKKQMLEEETAPAPEVYEVSPEADRKSILVIDDEIAVNNNIRKILSKKGYHVEQAVTKDEALQKIEQKAYKLILLDLRIPGVKGLELLKTIRDKRPNTKVIIITGYASLETAIETARMGAVNYLAKPFTPDEIRKATDEAWRVAA